MGFPSSIGLAIPAGLNAYIPLLAVAVANYFGWLTLRAPFDLLGNAWVIGTIEDVPGCTRCDEGSG